MFQKETKAKQNINQGLGNGNNPTGVSTWKILQRKFLFSQHSNEGNGKQPRDMKDRQYHQKKEKTILASD